MIITLYLKDKLIDYRLPHEKSGSFNFDPDKTDNGLIHVEAKNGQWFLYRTEDVRVFYGGKEIDMYPLSGSLFFILQREKQSFFIHVHEVVPHSILTYSYNASIRLSCGNQKNNSIYYDCPYLVAPVSIQAQEKHLVLERPQNVFVYINKKAMYANKVFIQIGDEVEIYGLRILFLRGLLLIENIPLKLEIHAKEANLTSFSFPLQEKEKEIEIKELPLYKAEDYYSKAPRLRRIIEEKTIKLSPPPNENSGGELPIILVVGPMLTMGISSGAMLFDVFSRIYQGTTTWKDSWLQVLISGAMLISMVFWPMVTQAYNKALKKRRKQELYQKYGNYLKEKEKELVEEANLQKVILYENLISVEECIAIIEHKNIHFWDKKIEQSDFLEFRFGIGRTPLHIKLDYSEEDFTIEEEPLRKQADALKEKYAFLDNIPVSYSFYENKITAIMGSYTKTHYFMNDILLQLLTFYSYEEVKVVLFTQENHANDWSYLKYLNHNFNNERTFRFFSTNVESARAVNEYLMSELAFRTQSKNTYFKPYYFVVIDGFDQVKRFDFVKMLATLEQDIGIRLVILENRLSKLPSHCNNFITIGENQSQILQNSYEQQKRTLFQDEIHYYLDMMKYAKILANTPIEFEDGMKPLPNAISFLEMERVGKVQQLNILNRWNTNDATISLKAAVGVDEQGDYIFLDLHEKAHGPHGLIAGMTGSGKSEFIITYILSMAINYSPNDVSFILIDYKGGGLAFAFENKALHLVLPHLAGTITNLDKAEMDRTLVSIDSEIKRRQEKFNEAKDLLGESTMDIYKYQRFYKEGRIQEPISHLMIICDEFAELKAQQPEFMDNLISVARIGRSLGVHLILATQKPSGVVNDQIWSNSRFRVCLKVQDALDSKEMLKRPEAASIKQTGRFYLQVGYDEYFVLGQSAYCGAPYYPSEKLVKQVDKSVNFINDHGEFIKSIQASSSIRIKAKGEQLSAILKEIIQIATLTDQKAKRLWLENIPASISLESLEEKYAYQSPLQVSAILGEYDAPEKQEQGLVIYDYLKDGNTISYGNDGREQEMLLSTLLYATVKQYSARKVQYYIVDYGAESFRKFAQLPHIGGIVFAGEEDAFQSLFKMIQEEINKRKRLLSSMNSTYQAMQEKLPLIVVILNNYDAIYESHPDLYDFLPELVRDSERYGVIFFLTANGTNSVSAKISQNCPNIYGFKLKDMSDYFTLFQNRSRIVPRNILGRGLVNIEGIHEFQVASPPFEEDPLKLDDFLLEMQKKNDIRAKKIPVLPNIVRFQDVASALQGITALPVGIAKNNLEIMTLDCLSNLGTVVVANKINSTEKFVKSLIMMIGALKQVHFVVIDAFHAFSLSKTQFPNCYHDAFDKAIDDCLKFLEEQAQQAVKKEGILLIYGFSRFVSKLENLEMLQQLFSRIKDYEKMGIIIVDGAPKLKAYVFEPWFSSLFSLSDGIWIGRGITDQSLLRLGTVTREMTQNYKADMGYFLSESVATLVKWIDFVTEEDVK